MTVSLAISRIRQIRGEEMPKASTFVKKASDKVGLAIHLVSYGQDTPQAHIYIQGR